jgi:hypothetical protein
VEVMTEMGGTCDHPGKLVLLLLQKAHAAVLFYFHQASSTS